MCQVPQLASSLLLDLKQCFSLATSAQQGKANLWCMRRQRCSCTVLGAPCRLNICRGRPNLARLVSRYLSQPPHLFFIWIQQHESCNNCSTPQRLTRARVKADFHAGWCWYNLPLLLCFGYLRTGLAVGQQFHHHTTAKLTILL